jgi:hypothetical protein
MSAPAIASDTDGWVEGATDGSGGDAGRWDAQPMAVNNAPPITTAMRQGAIVP